MRRTDNTIPFGSRGEEIAARYLEGKGYRLLERSYRFGHKEIDIIARDEKVLVFIEVKTRSRRDGFPPFMAVNSRKRTHILKTAKAYLSSRAIPPDLEIRFDVISIIIHPTDLKEIEHIEDAFRS